MTEIELQAGYLYEYMRAHLTHVKLVEYNPDRLQRVKQQGLDKIIQTLQYYATAVSRESNKKTTVEFLKWYLKQDAYTKADNSPKELHKLWLKEQEQLWIKQKN